MRLNNREIQNKNKRPQWVLDEGGPLKIIQNKLNCQLVTQHTYCIGHILQELFIPFFALSASLCTKKTSPVDITDETWTQSPVKSAVASIFRILKIHKNFFHQFDQELKNSLMANIKIYVSCRSQRFDCVNWVKNSIYMVIKVTSVFLLSDHCHYWFYYFLHKDCCFVAKKHRLQEKAFLVPFGTADWS